MNIKGLSIDDIMNLDPQELSKLTRSELAKITSRLVSASNKRIRRLAKTELGQSSPAYIGRKGKPFSVKGKGVNELRNEFKNLKNFLGYKTSTAKGWKEVRLDVEKRLGGSLDKTTSKKFWETYRRLQETNAGAILDKKHRKQTRNTSDRIQKKLYNVMKKDWNISMDDALDIMQKKINKIYESEQNQEDY